MSVEYRLLGPFEVVSDDGSLLLPGGKPRALLALLILHAGDVVASDALVEALWPEEAPATAGNALQGYIAQLRRLLGWEAIETRPPGYMLVRGSGDRIDLTSCEQAFHEGREALAADRPGEAGEALRKALAFFRGTPLADFRYESFAQPAIARLEELRLSLLEDRIEADVRAGRAGEVVGEVEALVGTHPLRERLHRLLMLTLYRSERQADALAAYQTARRMLVDELGIEPSPALQLLERQILSHDPEIEVQSATSGLPQGRVTLLFTDIENSTQLLRELDRDYADLLVQHRRLLRAAVSAHRGSEVDCQGDGFLFAFADAKDAVAAAVVGERALSEEHWPRATAVRVRMGIHTGEPRSVEGGYVGVDVHRAARIASVAHGGQVLLSGAVRAALPEVLPTVSLRELGEHPLKDFPEAEALYQVEAVGLESDFPPLRGSLREIVATADRSILAVSRTNDDLASLISLGRRLARCHRPHELVLIRITEPQSEAFPKDELARASDELRRARDALAENGISTRVAAFASGDPAADISRLATLHEVDLVLMSGSQALLRDGQFEPTTAELLTSAPPDVGIVIDRTRSHDAVANGRVLVPFGGGEHDWAALELAAWLASGPRGQLVILGTQAESDTGRRDASRLIADAALLVQRFVSVAATPLLVPPGRKGVLSTIEQGDLLVLGLSERWRDEGLGAMRWGLACTIDVPLVLVRRGLRPGALAPRSSLTRFTWSLSAAAQTTSSRGDRVSSEARA